MGSDGQVGKRGRKRPRASREGDGGREEEERKEQEQRKLKLERLITALEDSLLCGVCQGSYIDAVSLMPCLHTFCGACLKPWLLGHATCPQCRIDVSHATESRMADQLTEALIEYDPTKARPTGERDQAKAIYKRGERIFATMARDEDDESDMDEDLVFPCPCCAPGNTNRSGYTCARPIPNPRQLLPYQRRYYHGDPIPDHLTCCGDHFPDRDDQETNDRWRCTICKETWCGAYQDCPAAYEQPRRLDDMTADPLPSSYGVPEFTPASTRILNPYEASLLRNYCAEQFAGSRDLYTPLLYKILNVHRDRGKEGLGLSDALQRDYNLPPIMTVDKVVCEPCRRILLDDCLFDWWIVERIRFLPAGELARPDCTEGRFCTRQWVNYGEDTTARDAHNREFNHIWRETPASEVANAASGSKNANDFTSTATGPSTIPEPSSEPSAHASTEAETTKPAADTETIATRSARSSLDAQPRSRRLTRSNAFVVSPSPEP
ncbi:uncharacterized protein L969DRAFT_92845 [Mixia osmundae IAM 14324]|uniref:uncharacterized protein n=1 Tax=Mixia osmundae (strain CBS 9802 / IAM 14324 / JCM 22182 / KY 12970) TaxID=764103 RepID=UPI0004A551A0|nr:uncharacterized protein L969DRAFT_92845 [Mixia osmundae IAM 14324]KEI41619.1 hypothetical protein L969DRAFT_92845 [Mixia osmundae IAM 14324]